MHNTDFFKFIEDNKGEDPDKLRLIFSKKKLGFDIDLAINQIACKKKFYSKLNKFIENPHFLFPDILSGEQASHQAVASFNESLFPEKSRILDMTAGLGSDALSFALAGNYVTAIEKNKTKAEMLMANAKAFNLPDFKVINEDSVMYFDTHNSFFDVIFIDPARRDDKERRVYNLHDCSPDVIELQSLLSAHSSQVFIKASPLLDITQTIKDFPLCSAIYIVGVKGECKEVLIELSNIKLADVIKISAVNLDTNGEIISDFNIKENPNIKSKFGEPMPDSYYLNSEEDFIDDSFILEPSAMVMKMSPWKDICERFNAKKFDKSSHLFITNLPPSDFPGRVTKFKSIINKKDRKNLVGFPASVISRNHPLSSEDIRKKFKLSEGDNNFIYASRINGKPLMLISESQPR